jgi:hypothetical protein
LTPRRFLLSIGGLYGLKLGFWLYRLEAFKFELFLADLFIGSIGPLIGGR